MKLDERIPGEDGAVLQLEGVDVGELEAGGPADELFPADLLLRVAGDPDDAALVVEAVVVVVPVGAPQVVPALVVLALAAARVAERAVRGRRGRRGRHEQEEEPTQLHDLAFSSITDLVALHRGDSPHALGFFRKILKIEMLSPGGA